MQLNKKKKRNQWKKYKDIFLLFCFELWLFILEPIMKYHSQKEKTIIFSPVNIKIDWWPPL